MKFDPYPVPGMNISISDNNAEEWGIPKSLLMECAGLQATEAILKQFSINSEKAVAIFCGTGNNGGDGFVIARHLLSRGIKVLVVLCGPPSKIRTPEARLNWQILSNLKFNLELHVIKDSSAFSSPLMEAFNHKIGLVVDALLGTGIQGALREPIRSAIQFINQLPQPKVSIDIPSGLDPDSGEVPDIAVSPDFRVTFHREKRGLKSDTSKLIAPIGIPLESEWFAGVGDLRHWLKPRNTESHKGEYGKLLVIGGSEYYSGAPGLAAMAAAKLGIDLIFVAAPKSASRSIQSFDPNLIVRGTQAENFAPTDLESIKSLSATVDALVIGPGIGRSTEAQEFCKSMLNWLNEGDMPCVIDADALYCLSRLTNEENYHIQNPHFVMTPHRGELQRFFPSEPIPPNGNFHANISFLSEKLSSQGGIWVVKGKYDYIVDASEDNLKPEVDRIRPSRMRINKTGCAEMAVGGTGDVLSGIIGALLSLDIPPFHAGLCGAYINGSLGEITRKNLGKRIQATDLIDAIPFFLKN